MLLQNHHSCLAREDSFPRWLLSLTLILLDEAMVLEWRMELCKNSCAACPGRSRPRLQHGRAKAPNARNRSTNGSEHFVFDFAFFAKKTIKAL
jgi:hypothetical protein